MRATCAADFIASSTFAAISSGLAASPAQSTAMLPGASGHTCGGAGLHRLAQIGDRIERRVVHLDRLGAVLRRREGFSDHHGDRLAGMRTRSPAKLA